MKRKLLLVMSILALILTSCGTKDNEPTDDSKVRIGVVTPQTGPVSIYGKANENGIKLATKEINDNGGIGGREIELVVMDDKGEITDAVTSFNLLMEENVDVVIGAFTSKPSLALAETAKNYEVPVITPGGTQEDITLGKPNVITGTS